ncbi:AtpZ/AtpI family protein [Nocardioides sp.]|uniref:AtpZ/AtpI family protein n=1 Tax=Nocardioides sp. TaxID=35761 RepID=UPI0035681F83
MADEPTEGGLRGRDLVGIGGMLAGAVVFGLVLGLLIDDAFDSTPVFTLIGIALGMVAGALGFWVRVRAALR